jgi:hypothetical protein
VNYVISRFRHLPPANRSLGPSYHQVATLASAGPLYYCYSLGQLKGKHLYCFPQRSTATGDPSNRLGDCIDLSGVKIVGHTSKRIL